MVPKFYAERKSKQSGTYKVFSHTLRRYKVYTLDELKLKAKELPPLCKKALSRALEKKEALSSQEQEALVELADLSMQIWGGQLHGELPYTHIEEYFDEFYLTFVKYLLDFDLTKLGAYVSRCRYIGADTKKVFYKEIHTDKRIQEAYNLLRDPTGTLLTTDLDLYAYKVPRAIKNKI